MTVGRRSFLTIAGLGTLGAMAGPMLPRANASTNALEVFKTPWCGCCGSWVTHMRANDFTVRVTEMEDLDPVKRRFNIPEDLQACHTGLIDGYVIEGHVPARDVQRLLVERPEAIGLSVPGMPVGSPGMEQAGRQDQYFVVLFSSTRRAAFARY